jgi:ATP-dependent RNA helicase DeaD
MPKPIQNLAETFLHDPEIIRMKSKEVTIDLIEQSYIEVPDRQKFDVLCRLLDLQEPDLAIIFVRTKRRVDEVSEALKKRGFSSEGIHGDLTQAKRDSVIRQFREKTIDILVATDVAARGLDISGVTHVFNYDLPQDPESYVHRVGRTGRAGQSGEATTFVIPREMEHLRTIEHLIKRSITRRKAPSFSEALEGAQQAAVRSLVNTTEEGDFNTYKANAEELLTHFDSVALLSAAIKLLTKEPDMTPVKITEEAPLRVHRNKSNNNRRRRDHDRNDRNDRGGRGHRPSGHRSNDRDARQGDRKSEGGHHDARRHYSSDNRGNYKGKSKNFHREKNDQHKETNHSVFKPYFKD